MVQKQHRRIPPVCAPSWRQCANKNWENGQNVNESVQTGAESNEYKQRNPETEVRLHLLKTKGVTGRKRKCSRLHRSLWKTTDTCARQLGVENITVYRNMTACNLPYKHRCVEELETTIFNFDHGGRRTASNIYTSAISTATFNMTGISKTKKEP
jgi:hypothetical protein